MVIHTEPFGRQKTCGRCGHTWTSHTEVPVRCPRCGTYHWQGAPTTNVCAVCGHRWFSRSEQTPLRCPRCKTRSWKDGPGDPESAGTTEEDTLLDRIVEMYSAGDGCVKIAMETRAPVSVVISTVRSRLDVGKNLRI